MSIQNPFKNTRIEFHILQSFPVTCLNRDDVGAPKSAIVGGVTRARVSSQCWKRQVRLQMQDQGIKLGVRTKQVEDVIKEACQKLGASEAQAKECGKAIASFLSKDTLHFFTETEAQAFAQFAQEQGFEAAKLKDKEVYKLAKKVLNLALDGLDIALFGRMVAQASDGSLNVEAAASFAHAISTHKVTNEIEFFTALDDRQQSSNEDEQNKTGSAHMGTLEFNSATYYRYISLDLGQLWQNLGGEGLPQAVEAFTKALYLAVPNARQTTQAGACRWNYAKVLVRQGQRLQVPFETPVKASKDGGFLAPSIQNLKTALEKQAKLDGSLFGQKAVYDFGENENYSLDHLVSDLKAHAEVRP